MNEAIDRNIRAAVNCPKCKGPLWMLTDKISAVPLSLKCPECGYYKDLTGKKSAGPGTVPANWSPEPPAR